MGLHIAGQRLHLVSEGLHFDAQGLSICMDSQDPENMSRTGYSWMRYMGPRSPEEQTADGNDDCQFALKAQD